MPKFIKECRIGVWEVFQLLNECRKIKRKECVCTNQKVCVCAWRTSVCLCVLRVREVREVQILCVATSCWNILLM